VSPGASTEDELLALQPPFVRAVGRRWARDVAGALSRGLTLIGAAREALGRLQAARRELSDETALTRREELIRVIARREGEARVSLWAAHRLGPAQASGADVVVEVACAMAQDPSWRAVSTAFAVLADRAGARPASVYAAVPVATALVADLDAAAWSQVAAWRFVSIPALRASSIAPRLAERLVAPAAGRDDLFVRAEVARLLGRCEPALAIPALERAGGDASEHVRMCICESLGALGAGPSLRRFIDASSEGSPRVRASAAIALAKTTPLDLEFVLRADPDELPRRVALEEAEPLSAEHPALRAAIGDLAAGAPWPGLQALAANACERLHHRLDSLAAATLAGLAQCVATLGRGESGVVELKATREEIGRALAVLTASDHPVIAEPMGGDRYRLTRGDRPARQLWRIWHELRHLAPDKRQSHRHTVGRRMAGALRADSGVLAEVSATRVPGERVLVPEAAGWGRHLPTIDDLLARPRDGEAAVFSSDGVTRLRFPSRAAWPTARTRIVLEYARLAQVRLHALAGRDAQERGAFARALLELGFGLTFEPYHGAGADPIVDLYPGRASCAPASGTGGALSGLVPLVGPGALGWWGHVAGFLRPGFSGQHTANQVAAVGVVAIGMMAARLHEARREIDRARAAIPLSIGGWGTRGKSGTERLKAALFQGLGCEVLAKTTGCEAMVLHAIPGLRAEELFLYRTYDKATIWEQRDTLQLAARFGVDVFLWECMALNPDYVDILQRHWMRDDLATVTNAYPDHENIQGPTGLDVAEVMGRFIPPGRTVLTAEEQMLPVLRDAAVARGSRLLNVRWRDHALLPQDVLARLPYDEHPRNVALVLGLAEELGVERDVALKEMADWLVPDLGVLKTYPEVTWKRRRLSFCNGMSANERTGFLSNWSRTGFDRADPDDVGEWVVTLVNNRADRLSRSAVFADILANDVAAHRHVLIGTNVRGLQRQISRSVRASLRKVVLLAPEELSLPPEARWERAEERASRALRRLQLGELGPERVAREANAFASRLGIETPDVRAEAFASIDACDADSLSTAITALRAPLSETLAALVVALGPMGSRAMAHLVDLAGKHAVVRRWQRRAEAALRAPSPTRAALVGAHAELSALFEQIAAAQLVVVPDPAMTGDQVIDAITEAAPPGFRVRIMGAQNIKGTGLDFAYRWVSLDRTARTLAELDAAREGEGVALARGLLARADLGILDLALAQTAFVRAAARATRAASEQWSGLGTMLAARAQAAEAAVVAGPATEGSSRAVGRFIEHVADVWDGVFRRRRSLRTMDELVAGRLSHAAAAGELRRLTVRQKGGWLFAPRRRPG
jgi:poly-gamma-glutamate synthase PgsB/CapB